jgi:hypothetical protein
MKTFKEMLQEITQECKDRGQIPLTSHCGKYFNLMYDEDTGKVTAEYFSGKNGYRFKDLSTVSEMVLWKIHCDVFELM